MFLLIIYSCPMHLGFTILIFWKFYKNDHINQKATCLVKSCNKVFKTTRGSTKALWTHLAAFHKQEYSTISSQKKRQITNANDDVSEVSSQNETNNSSDPPLKKPKITSYFDVQRAKRNALEEWEERLRLMKVLIPKSL